MKTINTLWQYCLLPVFLLKGTVRRSVRAKWEEVSGKLSMPAGTCLEEHNEGGTTEGTEMSPSLPKDRQCLVPHIAMPRHLGTWVSVLNFP